ncbi:MAG TPA: peptidase U32 family protein [bacterium]|nr:peptidase U32 family protein [bacterium]
MKIIKPELLAPVQDYITLKAALENGADAVYFGIVGFNMRANAKNFALKDLKKIAQLCHKQNVKAYLALNTIVFDNELKNVEKILKTAKKAGVDAIIAWDMAVVTLAKKLKLEVHLSTQASVANSQAAVFYKNQGIKRIVLARECTLEQIKKIKKQTKINLELFIHGAMCVSQSGRCFLSEFLYNKSANRGACLQPCRREYLIKQIEGEEELILGQNYVLSPKDLCTLPFLEKILEAGVASLKIEGRNRNPEYVATVTKVYRGAIDWHFKNKGKNGWQKKWAELKNNLMKELEKVYHRGLSSGFYLGQPINQWSESYGSQATEQKIHLGKVLHYYPKIQVAEILIQANKKLTLDEEIIFEGEKIGIIKQKVLSMQINHKKIKSAQQDDIIAIKTEKPVCKNDLVYKLIKRVL